MAEKDKQRAIKIKEPIMNSLLQIKFNKKDITTNAYKRSEIDNNMAEDANINKLTYSNAM